MKLPALASCALLMAVAGCSHLPGAPKPGDEVARPDSITNFATLYGRNCAGCHGDHGQNGASFDLANPIYQSWVDDSTLRTIIANGEPGSQMPAFAKSAGGFLADAQVDALVQGMRANWQKSGALNGTPPPYTTELKGDVAHGQQVYQAECEDCHKRPSRNITSPTFLALVNDQTLRTIIIAGRPDIGMPNWQDKAHQHPLTDQEVTDVVAWLAAQRTQTPGQPYSHPQ
jgi:mono/diheme cytochrome c family protein